MWITVRENFDFDFWINVVGTKDRIKFLLLHLENFAKVFEPKVFFATRWNERLSSSRASFLSVSRILQKFFERCDDGFDDEKVIVISEKLNLVESGSKRSTFSIVVSNYSLALP